VEEDVLDYTVTLLKFIRKICTMFWSTTSREDWRRAMTCEPRKEKTVTFQKYIATFQILTATGPRG
jgi:hypothetical protein